MQVSVHRCRFIDFTPTSINVIAYNKNNKNPMVAVGRSNGDIELYDVRNGWKLETTIRGAKKTSVEALAFTSNGRLFSCGLHGWITEWCLDTLSEKSFVESYGGAVWSIGVSPDNQSLACGCDDGSVRLYDISNDAISYVRAIDNQPGRVLSLAWNSDGKWLVTGSSRGQIRIINVHNSALVKHMNADHQKDESVIVWSVALLNENVVASGDSTGKTCFWDVSTGTLKAEFVSHDADVLSVASNDDGTIVYSSGVDYTIVQFQYLPTKDKWAMSHHKRTHMNDIRSLCYGSFSENSSFLVSGGLDCQLKVINDPHTLPIVNLKTIIPFLNPKKIKLAKASKMIMVEYDECVKVWKFADYKNQKDKHQLFLKLNVNSPRFIHCSALSDNGVWIAISTIYDFKLFNLQNGVTKLDFEFSSPESRALVVLFNEASTQMIVSKSDYKIEIYNLDIETCQVHFKCELPAVNLKLPVKNLLASKDGKWLICNDSNNMIIVYSLETMVVHYSLAMAHSIMDIAIHPSLPLLFVGLSDSSVSVLNLEQKDFHEWTNNLSLISKDIWPDVNKPIKGLFFHPKKDSCLIIWNLNSFCEVDLTMSKADGNKKKKRKAEEMEPTKSLMKSSVKVFKDYHPLLFLDFISHDEVVVIEKSWLSVLENLPPAFYKSRFGS